jgi:hypothetical protein
MIGLMLTPADVMSISRKLMPSWRRALSEEVRTRQKIQSAYCASVVQVLVPLTM